MIVFTLSQIICDILDQILIILLPRSSDAPGLLLQKAVPSDIKSDADLLTRWLRYDGVCKESTPRGRGFDWPPEGAWDILHYSQFYGVME